MSLNFFRVILTIYTLLFLNSRLHSAFGTHLLYKVQSHIIFHTDSEEMYICLDVHSGNMHPPHRNFLTFL